MLLSALRQLKMEPIIAHAVYQSLEVTSGDWYTAFWSPRGPISLGILTTQLGYMHRGMLLYVLESLFPSNCWKYSHKIRHFPRVHFSTFCQLEPKQTPCASCRPMMQCASRDPVCMTGSSPGTGVNAERMHVVNTVEASDGCCSF